MDERLFWRLKLIQFFHDPLNKPLTGYPFIGKQRDKAKKYSELCIGHRVYLNKFTLPADLAAAGADRPVLNSAGYGAANRAIHWYRNPIVSHPLAPREYQMALKLKKPNQTEKDEPQEDRKSTTELAWRSDAEMEQAARAMGEKIQGWNNSSAATLKADYLAIYRELRELLDAGGSDFPWSLLPADSRVPDHAIGDHIKVTCALNALLYERDDNAPGQNRLPAEREPWLLRFSLGPVGEFIAQSRSGRDLWTSSFLLAELVWQAIEVFVERYGPDCILYPELNGNPRADNWLHAAHELLRDDNPNTFAAVVPNAFVALIPRGGKGHLEDIETLAENAKSAVLDKWKELRDVVFDWLEDQIEDQTNPDHGWQNIWQGQDELPLRIEWNAVPWRKPEAISSAASLEGLAMVAVRDDAIPPQPPKQDRDALEQRKRRLRPWVPQSVWTAYEQARRIYAALNLGYVQNERGFDYALTHHQLGVRHQLGKQAPEPLPDRAEGGEKCTLCGERQALHNGLNNSGPIDRQREAVRKFWSNQKLDPDETGAERLCSVCTVKRFLVEAGRDVGTKKLTGLTPIWAGPETNYEQVVAHTTTGPKVRQPFPSTSMIAAQRFLLALHDKASQLASEIQAVVAACQRLKLPRTAFPDALPQLAPLHRNGTPLKDFLEYDPQDTLFPTALEGPRQKARQQENSKKERAIKRLQDAVNHLLKAARKQGIDPPETRIAVIKIDGDNMGRLLLGDGASMGATLRDILHPEMIDRIVAPDENNPFAEAGLPELLDAKRLMGPSLHAFITRALGHFAHRIVPWVVEREYSGRVIYSGGDDVLCIAPADEALEIAARLQQLWSATWVVDTGFDDSRVNGYHSEWAWRLPGWEGSYDRTAARRRFQILRPSANRIDWPVKQASQLEPHVSDDDAAWEPTELPLRGDVLPLLGPTQSLSAGIAYAHFKTAMSHLVRTAEYLLEEVAKNRAGRGAVAVKLFSRNAEKSEFALPWRDSGEQAGGVTAHRHLNGLIEAFRTGKLPARLPYKLREQSMKLGLETAQWQDETGKRLLRGLLSSNLESDAARARFDDLIKIWEQGIELALRLNGDTCNADDTPPMERSLDGLLFCRAMAGSGDEEE